MAAILVPTDEAPTALLRNAADLPMVDLGAGGKLRLLNADLAQGVWTILMEFPPGTTLQTHYHTGHVHAFTRSGSWWYLESPDAVNVAGSYLFEPAGSKHTLHVPDSNDESTEVWFSIHGANLNLDADGNVTSVLDAAAILQAYRMLCEVQHGLTDPPVVVIQGPRP